MMKIFTNSKVVLLIDQAIFSGSSFLLTIFVARLLSLEDFGIFSSYFLAIYLVVSSLGSFTIQPFQVLIGTEKSKASYVAFSFWFHIASLVLFFVFGFLIHFLFPSLFPYSFLAFGIGFLFHDFSRKLLLAMDKIFETLLVDLLAVIISMISLLSFHLFSNGSLGSLMVFISMPYIASFVLVLFFVKPFLFNKELYNCFVIKHWQIGKWMFLTAISQWWAGNLFVVASGFYLGTASLAALRLSQSLMGVLNVLLQAFENYVLPLASKKLNSSQTEGLSFVTEISKKAGFLFFSVLLSIFLFAEQIIVMVGRPEYAEYDFVLRGMSVLYFLIFASQPIRIFIRAMLLNQHFFYGYLISLIFSLCFSHLLFSSFGLVGAVLGMGISQLILMVYWSFILNINKIYLWKSFISF